MTGNWAKLPDTNIHILELNADTQVRLRPGLCDSDYEILRRHKDGRTEALFAGSIPASTGDIPAQRKAVEKLAKNWLAQNPRPDGTEPVKMPESERWTVSEFPGGFLHSLKIRDRSLSMIIYPDPKVDGGYVSMLIGYAGEKRLILDEKRIGPIQDIRSVRNIAYESAKKALEKRIETETAWLQALRLA